MTDKKSEFYIDNEGRLPKIVSRPTLEIPAEVQTALDAASDELYEAALEWLDIEDDEECAE